MILWRISEYASLDGLGGLAVAGRWHSKGRPIVYAAESSALAMLETLVHLEIELLPPPFQLLKIEAPDRLAFVEWPGDADHLDLAGTRHWGDDWLAAAKTPMAKVPSAVAPGGTNWLINPTHGGAGSIRILAAARWPWDPRLLG